jgi:hypothetical protein
MRHLLLALVICGIGTFPVAACMPKPGQTDARLFEEADEVFVARVIKTELVPVARTDRCPSDDFCNYIAASYSLVQSLKGAPPEHGQVRENIFAPGLCGLGLVSGWYYVFYTTPKDNRMVLYTEGSFPLGPSYNDSSKQVVQRLRKPGHVRPKDGA